MYRNPTKRDVVLESLVEERDDVAIKISILRETDKVDADRLEALRKRLRELELLIQARQREHSRKAVG